MQVKNILNISGRFMLFLVLFNALGMTMSAQRIMESLNRGLAAVGADDNVFISWRKFGTDSENISFNLYRNDTLVNADPIVTISNYLDENGTKDSYYYLEVLENGEVISTSNPVVVWADGYKDIPLQTPEGYSPNDASVADLDGDGELEIVVKMQGVSRDNSQSGYTDPVFLQAYKMNGTLLWSIDLGINIRAGSHYTQFMVYDLDGDGRAELACKTAPGTKDGTGNYLSDGIAADDDDAADYRNSYGYILEGPEYLTLFEGKTGKEISTMEYVPVRGNVMDWGDAYGNRADRFLACVAYFDTIPSLVMARGYYSRTVLAAWDYKDGELVQRWVFDSDNGYPSYEGQGAHSLSVGDVDEDGKDEIMYGAMAIDDDGSPLYNTNFYHGDATHLGDFILDHPGQEFYMPCETAGMEHDGITNPSLHVRDAATGAIIWTKPKGSKTDNGRAMVADVLADHPGCEFWAQDPYYMYDQNGNFIVDLSTTDGPSQNFGSWWDGDLQREILSGNAIKKWTIESKVSLLEPAECVSNNDTKATPALSGDILGDWREEVIWRTADNQNLRIFTTNYPTQYGLYTLLHDPQYRLALTWQNVGYNQPPHPSFFIGSDMEAPPTPDIKMSKPEVDPTLEITFPTDGYVLQLGKRLSVTFASYGISDTTTIYLKNGDTDLDTIKGAPFVTTFEYLDPGEYVLNAWCYGPNQEILQTGSINVTVDEGLPHVTLLTPEDGSLYGINDPVILLSADAYDSDGTIDSVTFYINNEVAAVTTESPYEANLENPGLGTYSVMAIAFDNDLNRDTSEIHYFEVESAVIIQEKALGFCGFLTSGYYENNHDGYTGEGFANTANETGAGISYAVKILETGSYKFFWRYSTETDRPGKVVINDTMNVTNLNFPNTDGSWDVWALESTDEVQLDPGIYEVKIIATSAGGLGNIDYMKISSFIEGAAEAVDCDSLSSPDAVENNISISDIVRIYPIPASESLTVKVLNGTDLINSISIYDLTGKQVLNKQYNAPEIYLDINELSDGIYFIKLNTTTGSYMQKLIVDR